MVSEEVWAGSQICLDDSRSRDAVELRIALSQDQDGAYVVSLGTLQDIPAVQQRLAGGVELLSFEPPARCAYVFASLEPLEGVPPVAAGEFGLNAFAI